MSTVKDSQHVFTCTCIYLLPMVMDSELRPEASGTSLVSKVFDALSGPAVSLLSFSPCINHQNYDIVPLVFSNILAREKMLRTSLKRVAVVTGMLCLAFSVKASNLTRHKYVNLAL